MREKLEEIIWRYLGFEVDDRMVDEILSLLGENETGVSGSQDKHGDLQPVSESNASTGGESEHGTLEKITDSEKKCNHKWTRGYRWGRVFKYCTKCGKEFTLKEES